MKSAYELAMERLGGKQEYTDEKKQQLADVDNRYTAKIAEAKIRADEQLKKAMTDPAIQDTIQEELARDIARFEEKRESEKDKVRAQE